MIKRSLWFAVFAFGLVGCTDTVDTITREIRNQNNEVIDSLMMVNSEASANRYTVRVFAPMVQRYQSIDARLNIVRTNRSKKEFVKEVLESDGFQLYLAERDVNKQRLALEMTRLRLLVAELVKRERERLINEGEADPDVNPLTLCPKLNDIVAVEGTLDPLRQQLSDESKLLNMVRNFPTWKLEDYDKQYKRFLERSKSFQPPEVKLVH